jgi:cell division protein DivIC
LKVLKKIGSFFINKYFLTTVAFAVWLVFFDSNSLVERNKLQEKLDVLNMEKRFYLDEIKRDSTLSKQLVSDSAQLEKFARERYLMKKENEDVYLVIDTTADQHR